MKKRRRFPMIQSSVVFIGLIWLVVPALPAVADEQATHVRWWLTSHDLQHRLDEQAILTLESTKKSLQASKDTIVVNEKNRFQEIVGLGSSLEPSTCYNLWKLSPSTRTEVLTQLFHPKLGIGINLSRICIGTPDFTSDPWYTYDDVPQGQQDRELRNFSIDKDRRYIIPMIKAALEINPELLIFASPWSPPGWMTSTDDMIGGQLRPEFYPVYAKYLVRFIHAYQEQGIPIHAITVQNEPGVDRSGAVPRWRYPSCRFSAEQERDFIRDHLGPALGQAGLTTKIWCYDHNYNTSPSKDGDDPGVDYPRTILLDSAASRYVSGVAFHGYVGKPSAMSLFREEFPGTPLHFTEGSVFGPRGGRRLVELLRNWASSYNGWVTMLTTDGKPNNGPFRASKTCVTVNPEYSQVSYHYDYYQYGHFFRFIKRGGSSRRFRRWRSAVRKRGGAKSGWANCLGRRQ